MEVVELRLMNRKRKKGGSRFEEKSCSLGPLVLGGSSYVATCTYTMQNRPSRGHAMLAIPLNADAPPMGKMRGERAKPRSRCPANSKGSRESTRELEALKRFIVLEA